MPWRAEALRAASLTLRSRPKSTRPNRFLLRRPLPSYPSSGSVFALAFLESWGLRAGVLLGAAVQLANNGIKLMATASRLSPHAAFALFMVGQLVGGMGQAFFLNCITRVSMDWFPPGERDMATTAAWQSIGLGVMFFSWAPPRIVRAPEEIQRLILLEVRVHCLLPPWHLFLFL